jgi:phosphoserine phosphatase RsbU/P
MTLYSAEKIYCFEECTVLIVDDDDFNHEVVRFFLDEMGIKKVLSGYDGVEGLELVNQHHPHLIILDIVMPRLGGLDVLRRLRSLPGYAQTPVIVLTGNDSSDSRDAMFTAGATDYVTKPILAKEFHGRVKTHLKNLLLVKGLEVQLETISNELRTAAELQRSMLPAYGVQEQIKLKYGIKIHTLFEPSSALGGDFFGFYPLNEQAFGFYLCDFAGHGVGAALNTVLLHTMIGRLPAPDPTNPAAYLSLLNDALYLALTNRYYATFLYGVVDVEAKTLTYASAGSPSPLIIMGKTHEWLPSSGMPLGLIKGARYETRQVPFHPGNRLFMYSDALIESPTRDREMFGDKAVAELVMGNKDGLSTGQHLSQLIEQFMSQASLPLDDDLTILYMDWDQAG